MQLAQVEVKLFIDGPEAPAAEELIRVFHQWIRDKRLGSDKLLIDVADYSHVKHGPGVMLVGHDIQYRMDNAEGRPGLLFARKRDEPGAGDERLRSALHSALEACRALETDPDIGSQIRFRGDEIQVKVMNRLTAPNTDDSYVALEGQLTQVVGDLYPGSETKVERTNEPRGPLAAVVTSAEKPSLGTLLDRLNSN